jgi:sigma-B regulation protein RsbU (phosphoserine phosphatase)
VRSSLASRLIVPLTLSAGFIIALGLFLDYRLSRAGIVRQLETSAGAALAGAGTHLSELAAGVEEPIRRLADLAARTPGQAAMIETELAQLVANNRHVKGAAFAVNPALVDEAGGEPRWVDPCYDSGGAELLMTTFSAPVFRRGSDNEFLGVLTADIALADFRRQLAAVDLGALGFAFVLSGEGRIMGPRDPAFAAQPVEKALRARGEDSWPALLARAAAGETVRAPVDCIGITGDCRLRLEALPATGWIVGAVYSEAEVLQPLRNYETRVVTVGLAMLLLIIVTVTIVARRLTRPIEALARASGAVARGHLGVELPQVRGDDEISQLVRAFDAMRRDLGDYILELAEATASRSRIEGELTAARDIQLSMLPQRGKALFRSGNTGFWAQVRPARSVGGDLYSFHLQGSKLLFALGDVSDKGVPAALFMARAISLIQQWEVQPGPVPPTAALHQLNTVLQADNENCMFLTLCLGVFDMQSLTLELAIAGHPPPACVDGDGARALELDSGPALGLEPSARFPGSRVQLQPGQRFVLYTDGLDEAFSPGGAMLGSEALLTIFGELAGAPLARAGERTLAAVDAFAEDTPQADDMSLLILDTLGAGTCRQGNLDAGPSLDREALLWLEREARGLGLDDDVRHDLTLALEEIITNISKYAGLEEGETVSLALQRREALVELAVRDPGSAFNPLEDARRARLGAATATAEVGGLGVHLMTGVTDEQHYRREDGCNVLLVIRYL